MTGEPHLDKCSRVVVGVDGSEASKDALRWAAQQARLTGAELEVVMTWEQPFLYYGNPIPPPANIDYRGETEETLHRTVQEVLGETGDEHVICTAAEGPAAPTLLREAEGADLLVVGSRGHGTLVGMLLGSVSERCVTHASCPVVVVHRAEPKAA